MFSISDRTSSSLQQLYDSKSNWHYFATIFSHFGIMQTVKFLPYIIIEVHFLSVDKLGLKGRGGQRSKEKNRINVTFHWHGYVFLVFTIFFQAFHWPKTEGKQRIVFNFITTEYCNMIHNLFPISILYLQKSETSWVLFSFDWVWISLIIFLPRGTIVRVNLTVYRQIYSITQNPYTI